MRTQELAPARTCTQTRTCTLITSSFASCQGMDMTQGGPIVSQSLFLVRYLTLGPMAIQYWKSTVASLTSLTPIHELFQYSNIVSQSVSIGISWHRNFQKCLLLLCSHFWNWRRWYIGSFIMLIPTAKAEVISDISQLLSCPWPTAASEAGCVRFNQ